MHKLSDASRIKNLLYAAMLLYNMAATKIYERSRSLSANQWAKFHLQENLVGIIRLIMVAIKKYHKVYIIEAVVVKPKGWPFK